MRGWKFLISHFLMRILFENVPQFLSYSSTMYNRLFDALIIAVVGYHLLISPYTKVEESFNIQAIHDILNYGIFPVETIQDNYDHVNFPGVVPRTFIGAVVISGFVKVVDFVAGLFGVSLVANGSQFIVQLIARGVLGLLNAFSLIKIRNSLQRVTFADKKAKKKGLIGFWYNILLLSQFHLLYYSSRTLPNFIALPVVNFAISKLIVGDVTGLTWLAFTGVIFRLEVGVFAGIIALVSSLVFGQSSLPLNVLMLVAGTAYGLVTTVAIDSYFWGSWVVPELVSFQFNILHGKSADWGVLPWSTYFSKFLLQLFRPPVIYALAFQGLLKDPADDGTKPGSDKSFVSHPARHSLRILFISSLVFIAVMSFQPHKEWRFIIYTIPIFTLLAANGIAAISRQWHTSLSTKLLILTVWACVIIGMGLSLLSGYISSFNYPGADAILFVNDYISTQQPGETLVHMDVASCMTGVSRFLEDHNTSLTYDKTENELELLKLWNNVDILITEVNLNTIGENSKLGKTHIPAHWQLLHKSQKFEAVTIIPIINLVQLYYPRKDSFYTDLVSNVIELDIDAVSTFIRSLILSSDYLYVYKRTKIDDGLELLIESLTPETENPVREEEEVLVGAESVPIEEVDLKYVGKEINSEIDRLESMV